MDLKKVLEEVNALEALAKRMRSSTNESRLPGSVLSWAGLIDGHTRELRTALNGQVIEPPSPASLI